jgi:hypothetical protein
MYQLNSYNSHTDQYNLSYKRDLDASSQYNIDGENVISVVNQELKKKMNTLNVLLLKAFGFADEAQTLRKMGNVEIEDDIKKELDVEEKRKKQRSIIAAIFIATAWLAPGILSFMYFPAAMFGWCGYSAMLCICIMANGDTDKKLGARKSFNSLIDAIGPKAERIPEDPDKATFIDAIIDKIKEDKTFFARFDPGSLNKQLNGIYLSSLTVATAVPAPEAVAVSAVNDGNTSSSDSDSKLTI